MEDGRKVAIMLGQANNADPVAARDMRIDIGKDIELTAACAHLLHIALQLFKQGVVGGHHHDRYSWTGGLAA